MPDGRPDVGEARGQVSLISAGNGLRAPRAAVRIYALFGAALFGAALLCASAFPQWMGRGGEIPFVGAVLVWILSGFFPVLRLEDARRSSLGILLATALRLVSAGFFFLAAFALCKVSPGPWLGLISPFYLLIILAESALVWRG